ncbi:MAG: hypothetical protein U0573_11715 [Phycisphaerales bacterium]|nr:hypothetical protein [Planctomycetota bacterium]
MKKSNLCALAPALVLGAQALASHHFMQIQIVIGGVGGDTTAQAIQLRQRFAGQNFVSFGKLVAFDAAGLNPVVIIDFTTNVTNSASGDTILVCTNSFKTKTSPTTVPDFVMTNPIPQSYLPAGKLQFMLDSGTVWWTVAWGGAGYTGTEILDLTNDSNGNAAPAFSAALPTASANALQYLGAATGASTTSQADYSVTPGAAVVRNNARINFTVRLPCPSDLNGDAVVDDGDFVIFANAYNDLICGSVCPADLNGDGFVDDSDFVIFATAYDQLVCP